MGKKNLYVLVKGKDQSRTSLGFEQERISFKLLNNTFICLPLAKCWHVELIFIAPGLPCETSLVFTPLPKKTKTAFDVWWVEVQRVLPDSSQCLSFTSAVHLSKTGTGISQEQLISVHTRLLCQDLLGFIIH